MTVFPGSLEALADKLIFKIQDALRRPGRPGLLCIEVAKETPQLTVSPSICAGAADRAAHIAAAG